MKTFKCVVCGKVGEDRSFGGGRLYCSEECLKIAKYSKEVCPYNEGVLCVTKKCDKCGWNPMVAAARSARLNISKQTREAIEKMGQNIHGEE